MLNLYFNNYFFLIPFFLFFTSFWIFFMSNNFYSVSIQPKSNDVLKSSKFMKKVHHNFLINWNFMNFFYFYFFIMNMKLDFNLFWFNHLKMNNFLLYIMNMMLFISFFVIFLLKHMKNTNANYSLDYFSSLFNLMMFMPMMFMSNTMYTFLFMLEINSLLILYKFSVSSNWFSKNTYLDKNKNSFDSLLPKSYLNMLFFQYWANFFSSMLIMFSMFNIMFIYGSSEWFFLNFLNNSLYLGTFKINISYSILLWLPFFTGLFLKMGFTPLHLFKIEVYKGMPFMSMFFYTTFYFMSFFLFFTMIMLYNLNSFKIFWKLMMYMFMIFGTVYSIFLLFDVNLTKAFFAYSTMVNVLTFIIIVFISLN